MMTTKIDKIWQELENDQTFSSGLLYKRYSAEVMADFYVALRNPGKMRCIAIRMDKKNLPPLENWSQLADIKVEKMDDINTPDKSFLIILIYNPVYKDIFSVLCEDLLFSIAQVKDEKFLINILLKRLEKWKDLFTNIGKQGLPKESQRGLYGELFFLRKLIIKSNDISKSVCSWLGPTGTAQDFQYGSWAAEIKTTHGQNHQKIHISNEQQLDDSLFMNLLLYHISFDILNKQGESLNDLVQIIRELIQIDFSACNLFNIRLIDAGYFDIHSNLYDDDYYNVKSEAVYKVGGNFPRIIGNSLNKRISDVKYSINVSDCDEYIISESDLFNIINMEYANT